MTYCVVLQLTIQLQNIQYITRWHYFHFWLHLQERLCTFLGQVGYIVTGQITLLYINHLHLRWLTGDPQGSTVVYFLFSIMLMGKGFAENSRSILRCDTLLFPDTIWLLWHLVKRCTGEVFRNETQTHDAPLGCIRALLPGPRGHVASRSCIIKHYNVSIGLLLRC